MKADLEPEVLNRVVHEIPVQCLNAEKARRVLGWTPLFTLDQGLEATIAWYRRFFEDESEG
jgi:CDP-glucose 4,6-dehydratase